MNQILKLSSKSSRISIILLINFVSITFPWNSKTISIYMFYIELVFVNNKNPWKSDIEWLPEIFIFGLREADYSIEDFDRICDFIRMNLSIDKTFVIKLSIMTYIPISEEIMILIKSNVLDSEREKREKRTWETRVNFPEI